MFSEFRETLETRALTHGSPINHQHSRGEREREKASLPFSLPEGMLSTPFLHERPFLFLWLRASGWPEGREFVGERCRIGGVLNGNSQGTAKSNHPGQSKRWAHKKPAFLNTQTRKLFGWIWICFIRGRLKTMVRAADKICPVSSDRENNYYPFTPTPSKTHTCKRVPNVPLSSNEHR